MENSINALPKFIPRDSGGLSTAVRGSPIPTGLCNKAQGCEERATLGSRPQEAQPQRGCATYLPPGHNPVGVLACEPDSQGSSCLATLGFEPESLWDSPLESRNRSTNGIMFNRIRRALLIIPVFVFAVASLLGAGPASAAPAAAGLFARTNLVAWCIVPFDTKKRGPEERGQMLEKLGIKKLAYDWRAEHIPTFDAEVAAMKRHGVDMTAWWFPGALNAEAQAILDCIKRNDIHPQLWVMLEGGPHLRLDKAFEATPEAQAAHVERMVAGVKPIAAEAAKLGCQVALYNHGGWFGIPENQIQIVERLKRDGITNVGMVYTQHHGHGEIDRFAELLPRMKPHLLALTLNGMIKDGDLPRTRTRHPRRWARAIKTSGFCA